MKKSIREYDEVTSVMTSFLVDLPSPSSISYMWNFGSLLGGFLVFQIFTGILLSIHFTGDLSMSFLSVVHIMRDVSSGWVMRVMHSNGASFFFLLIYMHMASGLYYGSYLMKGVWMSGVTIFLLSMITAFLGYVLPWGQMSFWAATVITNLMSAIPYLGVNLVEWIWGGYAVGNPTLTRFFSFHFVFPFIIVMVLMLHFMFLHDGGSSNPLGVMKSADKVNFHPFFSSKDILGVLIVVCMLTVFSLLWPFIFMDSENFLMSNPLVTPVHIQPEWYFLFAYSVLRSISSKMGGVVALMVSVMVFYVFPFLVSAKFQSSSHYPFNSFLFWIIVGNWVMLTWVGSCVVEYPFMGLGQVFSMNYFWFFMIYFFVKYLQDLVI